MDETEVHQRMLAHAVGAAVAAVNGLHAKMRRGSIARGATRLNKQKALHFQRQKKRKELERGRAG